MSLTIKSIKSLVPLLDRVLVQRVKIAEKTASGLYLPSSSTSSPNSQIPEAIVLAVGPGAPNKDGVLQAMSVKEGDRVVVPAFGGVGVKVGEEEYTFYRDQEIIAKLSE